MWGDITMCRRTTGKQENTVRNTMTAGGEGTTLGDGRPGTWLNRSGTTLSLFLVHPEEKQSFSSFYIPFAF